MKPRAIETIAVSRKPIFHRVLVRTNPGIRIIISEMVNWIEVRYIVKIKIASAIRRLMSMFFLGLAWPSIKTFIFKDKNNYFIMKFNLKKYITLKELVCLAILIAGLGFLYVGSAAFKYPYDTISLFLGYALIVVSIGLSIKLGK